MAKKKKVLSEDNAIFQTNVKVCLTTNGAIGLIKIRVTDLINAQLFSS